MLDKGNERALEIEHHGAAVEDGEVDHAVGRLQLGHAEQLVEHDLRMGILLQLDHEPNAFAVGLVAALGDAFDALVAD